MTKKIIHPKKHSFIFPVHNEALHLSSQIKLFYQLLNKERITKFEVLLVENGSSDQSWSIIKQLTKKYSSLRALRVNKASYGQALKHGILSSLGQFVYILNVDLFDHDFISQTQKLLKKHKIIIGSKTLIKNYDQRNLLRRAQTKLFHQLLKILFAYPGTDTHGLKAFRLTPILINTLRNCATKHEILDTELLLKLHQQQQTIKEIPIKVTELRPSRYTSWKRMRALLIDLYRLASFYLINTFDRKNIYQKNKLIIADDYGLSPLVDQAILNQIEAKNLDGVSVLANLISKSEAQKLLHFKKQIKIGLHFNLTRGKPITKSYLIPSLVNHQGNFFSLFIFLIKLLFVQIRLNEIDLELNNQFKRLESLTLSPTYVDSEQHIHTFNLLNQLVVKMTNQYKLSIRSTASTISYLIFRPHKYLMFCVLQALFFARYFSLTLTKNRISSPLIETNITHPGNLYD